MCGCDRKGLGGGGGGEEEGVSKTDTKKKEKKQGPEQPIATAKPSAVATEIHGPQY